MPEDVTHDLKAFTPVGLDRDAVLFAAGKTAARRWAGWKWLAAGLLVSNAVTLGVLFWPKPVPPTPPVVAVDPPPVEVPPSPPPEPYSYIALRNGDVPPAARDAGGTPALPSAPLTPRAIHDLRIP